MKTLNYDVIVIGGGPAGLAASLKACENRSKVAIIERNSELGGILNQCIHSGFGLQYFKKELTGPEYAELFINKVKENNIDIFLNTMVIDISKEKVITAFNNKGMIKINAKAVVLAMGCRERTRPSISIPGSRPAGVFTAGQAQRYMNLENLRPGNKVVILGSGDIGLIMARRLTLEGIEVVGVYELMPYANGLYRNIKHCLEDFSIPLHLSTTITDIIGKDRLEEIKVSKVNKNLKPIEGTEETIKCDTLLLSVGLIPENELSLKCGIEINPLTNGAIVDSSLETSVPGIFSCGNVLHVHDLVDNVTREAELAGTSASKFAEESLVKSNKINIDHGEHIRYTVPCSITQDNNCKIFFRVKTPIKDGNIIVRSDNKLLFKGKTSSFKPSKMENIIIPLKMFSQIGSSLFINVEEVL